MSIYYFRKYPFSYPFMESDGTPMMMCTIDVPALAQMYKARIGMAPRSFFDCGAAFGFMVDMACHMGMRAHGIEVKAYPRVQPIGDFTPYFTSGQIKMGSILDAAPIQADLAYCNGTLTYMNETTLPLALKKFRNVGMLIAIHNTNEDLIAAEMMGAPIKHSEPRLIRSIPWWMETFRKNGFNVDWDNKYCCFCARPVGSHSARILPPTDVKVQRISCIPTQYIR